VTKIPLFAGSRITIVTDVNERGELVGYASSEDELGPAKPG
jgi:hypothetical protein